MDAEKVFLIILFQGIVTVIIFADEKVFTNSHSAYFTKRRGHVLKRFEFPYLLSCGDSCLRNSWCTSTNFKTVYKNCQGTRELNKHETIDGNANFHDEQGLTFSKLRKVMHYF